MLGTVVLALLAACNGFEPPAGAERMTPPEHWRALYAAAEACSGLRGRFERVEFYVVPGDGWGKADGHHTGGAWIEPHRIYVAEVYLDDDWVVKHEMIHELRQRQGHPPVFTTCRATVEEH